MATMIQGLTQSGAMPVLERMIQFTAARHKVLTHNIANLSTPYFRPRELSPAMFQASLAEAVERRRRHPGAVSGPLEMRDTAQLRFHEDGMEIRPGFRDQNILFHDRNNRDLERIMQDLAENTLAHNAAIELMRSEFQLLRTAISGRV